MTRNELTKRIDLLHQLPVLLLQFAILLDQLIDRTQNVRSLLCFCLRSRVSGLSVDKFRGRGHPEQSDNGTQNRLQGRLVQGVSNTKPFEYRAWITTV